MQRDAFIDYVIALGGTITPTTDGRITLKQINRLQTFIPLDIINLYCKKLAKLGPDACFVIAMKYYYIRKCGLFFNYTILEPK